MSAISKYGFVAALAMLAPVSANAGLAGSEVDVNWYFPTSSSLYCSSGTATVGGGV